MAEHVHEYKYMDGDWINDPGFECECKEYMSLEEGERRLNATKRLPAHVAAGAWVIAGDDFSELRDYAAALEGEKD